MWVSRKDVLGQRTSIQFLKRASPAKRIFFLFFEKEKILYFPFLEVYSMFTNFIQNNGSFWNVRKLDGLATSKFFL